MRWQTTDATWPFASSFASTGLRHSGEADALLEALDDFLVVQAIGRGVLQLAPVHERDAAPRTHQAREVGGARGGLRRLALGAHHAAVLQPRHERRALFVVELLLNLRLRESAREPLVALQRLLHLLDVVGLQLGRGVDRGEAAADHDAGQLDLQVRERVPAVGALPLQPHQEVRSHADPARQVVLHRHDGRPARPDRERHVVEAQVPAVVERQRAAHAHAVEEPELLAAHQHDVVQVQEVLVPAHGDAVLGDAAEARGRPLRERADDLGDVLDRLGHAALGPAQVIRQRLDLQAFDADHAEALVQQVVRERVARGPHPDDQDVLAVVAQRIRAPAVQRVPARQERQDLEPVRQRENFGEDAGLELRDVDGVLLLEDARLHAVVADAVSRARQHRVVDHHDGERGHRPALAVELDELRDLLVQRTTRERDPERVLLGLALLVVQAGRARVLGALRGTSGSNGPRAGSRAGCGACR
jgi:hypothetical protein